MTLTGRVRRAVMRALTSDDLFARRNRKAHRQFDRWWGGVLVRSKPDLAGRAYWEIMPTGRGLIHNGRKPH